jgi:hypothetical protein
MLKAVSDRAGAAECLADGKAIAGQRDALAVAVRPHIANLLGRRVLDPRGPVSACITASARPIIRNAVRSSCAARIGISELVLRGVGRLSHGLIQQRICNATLLERGDQSRGRSESVSCLVTT